MATARACILDKGGVVAANVFTKIALALFGQYDWRGIPSMPPEIMLAAETILFQHLCDFLLVAGGADSSVDHFREAAVVPDSKRAGDR